MHKRNQRRRYFVHFSDGKKLYSGKAVSKRKLNMTELDSITETVRDRYKNKKICVVNFEEF